MPLPFHGYIHTNPFRFHIYTDFTSFGWLCNYHEVEVSPGCGVYSATGSP